MTREDTSIMPTEDETLTEQERLRLYNEGNGVAWIAKEEPTARRLEDDLICFWAMDEGDRP